MLRRILRWMGVDAFIASMNRLETLPPRIDGTLDPEVLGDSLRRFQAVRNVRNEAWDRERMADAIEARARADARLQAALQEAKQANRISAE